jgi:hypothetical protein
MLVKEARTISAMTQVTCFDASLPRVETAHVVITLHSTIHDGCVTLLLNALFCDSGIHPVRETPLLWTNLSPFDLATCVVQHRLFERRVEVPVIEEDVWIIEPAIEMPLDRFYGLQNSVQLLVSRQHHESCIRPRSVDLRLEAACHEGFVILFAYFPRGC